MIELNTSRLILPPGFHKKRKAIMKWFHDCDCTLANAVIKGSLNVLMAQSYYKMKVEGNPDLSKADKQQLAQESRVWKIPTPE